jgi:serine/threonine-protein kinase
MQRSRSSADGPGQPHREISRPRRCRVGSLRSRREAIDTVFAGGSDPSATDRRPHRSGVAPGTVVGNYRVLGRLATGGMGEVFRGEHVHLGRPVAIKFLHQRLIDNPDAVARFTTEARAVSRIRHPGVVALFDFGPHEGGAYLVMELLDGQTLSARLAGDPPLSPIAVVDIGIQLADALAAAHAMDVVHRDLKPDNILLVPDRMRPGGERAVLVDFGVAKIAAGQAPLHTLHGDLLGTPFYMAPEQCVSAGTVDHRSDIYSLGCVLYRLLSGQVPFDGSLMDILLAHQHSAAAPLRSIDPYIPIELESLIAQMMAKSPRARPADMTRVVRSLVHIAERSRVRRGRRTRAWLGAAVAAAIAAVELGHFAPW